MKLTQFDDLFPNRLGSGDTTLTVGTSGGSNGQFGGDVTGTYGALSVVGLRSSVSLGSNLGTGVSIGDTLTIISTAGTPVARFATPSNTGGSASFGSNATRVSASSAVGASTNSAREDHRHDGIGSITSSSSNTLGRGTFNIRQGNNVDLGWTDTDGDGLLDTVTINARAGGGGSGSGSGGNTTGQFIVSFDGGGSAITAGAKVDIVAPFTGTLTGWTLLADVSGSAVVDIWKDSYANFPPTIADTITASAKPTLSTATKATSSTLTGWSTAVTAGDILRFNLDSASTITRMVLVVAYSRP